MDVISVDASVFFSPFHTFFIHNFSSKLACQSLTQRIRSKIYFQFAKDVEEKEEEEEVTHEPFNFHNNTSRIVWQATIFYGFMTTHSMCKIEKNECYRDLLFVT